MDGLDAEEAVELVAVGWPGRMTDQMKYAWVDVLLGESLIGSDVRAGVKTLLREQARRPSLAAVLEASRAARRDRFSVDQLALEGERAADSVNRSRQRLEAQTGKPVSPADDDLVVAGELVYSDGRYVWSA